MRPYFLPIILAVILLMAIFVSYSIAVSLQHVPAILPYISDAGVLLPERSVFSQLINTAAIIQLLTFYVRFEQLKMSIIHTSRSMSALISPTSLKGRSRTLFLVNRLCLWLGFSISFGLSLIGNFQLESPPIEEHISSDVTPKVQLQHSTGISTDKPAYNDISNESSFVTGKMKTLESNLEAESSNANYIPDHSSIMQNIHWTGAFFTFIGGLVYMFIQGWLSLQTCICPRIFLSSEQHCHNYSQKPSNGETYLLPSSNKATKSFDNKEKNVSEKEASKCGCRLRAIIRLVISCLGFTFLVAGIVLEVSASMQDDKIIPDKENETESYILEVREMKNHKEQLSISAAFCEWFLTLLIVVYMLTLVPDFKLIELGRLNLTVFHSAKGKENNIDLKPHHHTPTESDCHIQENTIITSNTKDKVRTYVCCNYPPELWNSSRKQINCDRQVVKCASYRDVGQHDASFTLSSSGSSYMSDSRTTNISQCDNIDNQQCRHLLDESLNMGSNSVCCGLPSNNYEELHKRNDIQVYDLPRVK